MIIWGVGDYSYSNRRDRMDVRLEPHFQDECGFEAEVINETDEQVIIETRIYGWRTNILKNFKWAFRWEVNYTPVTEEDILKYVGRDNYGYSNDRVDTYLNYKEKQNLYSKDKKSLSYLDQPNHFIKEGINKEFSENDTLSVALDGERTNNIVLFDSAEIVIQKDPTQLTSITFYDVVYSGEIGYRTCSTTGSSGSYAYGQSWNYGNYKGNTQDNFIFKSYLFYQSFPQSYRVRIYPYQPVVKKLGNSGYTTNKQGLIRKDQRGWSYNEQIYSDEYYIEKFKPSRGIIEWDTENNLGTNYEVPAGWYLKGYNTKRDGTGESYPASFIYSKNEDVTLYPELYPVLNYPVQSYMSSAGYSNWAWADSVSFSLALNMNYIPDEKDLITATKVTNNPTKIYIADDKESKGYFLNRLINAGHHPYTSNYLGFDAGRTCGFQYVYDNPQQSFGFHPKNYHFSGWNTKSDGSGVNVTSDNIYDLLDAWALHHSLKKETTYSSEWVDAYDEKRDGQVGGVLLRQGGYAGRKYNKGDPGPYATTKYDTQYVTVRNKNGGMPWDINMNDFVNMTDLSWDIVDYTTGNATYYTVWGHVDGHWTTSSSNEWTWVFDEVHKEYTYFGSDGKEKIVTSEELDEAFVLSREAARQYEFYYDDKEFSRDYGIALVKYTDDKHYPGTFGDLGGSYYEEIDSGSKAVYYAGTQLLQLYAIWEPDIATITIDNKMKRYIETKEMTAHHYEKILTNPGGDTVGINPSAAWPLKTWYYNYPNLDGQYFAFSNGSGGAAPTEDTLFFISTTIKGEQLKDILTQQPNNSIGNLEIRLNNRRPTSVGLSVKEAIKLEEFDPNTTYTLWQAWFPADAYYYNYSKLIKMDPQIRADFLNAYGDRGAILIRHWTDEYQKDIVADIPNTFGEPLVFKKKYDESGTFSLLPDGERTTIGYYKVKDFRSEYSQYVNSSYYYQVAGPLNTNVIDLTLITNNVANELADLDDNYIVTVYHINAESSVLDDNSGILSDVVGEGALVKWLVDQHGRKYYLDGEDGDVRKLVIGADANKDLVLTPVVVGRKYSVNIDLANPNKNIASSILANFTFGIQSLDPYYTDIDRQVAENYEQNAAYKHKKIKGWQIWDESPIYQLENALSRNMIYQNPLEVRAVWTDRKSREVKIYDEDNLLYTLAVYSDDSFDDWCNGNLLGYRSFYKNGYVFDGLYYDDQEIIDKNFKIAAASPLFDENGNCAFDEDSEIMSVDLKVHWKWAPGVVIGKKNYNCQIAVKQEDGTIKFISALPYVYYNGQWQIATYDWRGV